MGPNTKLVEGIILSIALAVGCLIVGFVWGTYVVTPTEIQAKTTWQTDIESITPTQISYTGRLLKFERNLVDDGDRKKQVDYIQFYDGVALSVPSGAFHIAHLKDSFIYLVYDSTNNNIKHACLTGDKPIDEINFEWDKKQKEIDLKIKMAETEYKAKCEVLKAQDELTQALVKAYDQKQSLVYDSGVNDKSFERTYVVKGKRVSSTMRPDDHRWMVLTFDGGEKVVLHNEQFVMFKEGAEYVLKYGVSRGGFNNTKFPCLIGLTELPKKK